MQIARTAIVVMLCAVIAQASTISIDFDDLPPIQFSVTLDDGTQISPTLDGTFRILSPDGTETIIPKEFVPDGILPAQGEVPIAAPLPQSVSSHVEFSTDASAGLYYFSGGAAVGSSEPNNITAAVDPNAFPYSANLYANFASPVNDLTFTVSSDNDAGEIAQVLVDYGNGEQATISVVGNADPTDVVFMNLAEYVDVTSLSVVNVTDTFGLSYDDFTFQVADVPEPIGRWLVFAGCWSLLSSVRRMRRSAA